MLALFATNSRALDITDYDSTTTYNIGQYEEVNTISGISFATLQNGGTINNITGSVKITTLHNYSTRREYKYGSYMDVFANAGTINTISGGTIGTLVSQSGGTIGDINAGTITTINNAGSSINTISNSANIDTINNNDGYNTTINEIKGGTIKTLNNNISTKINTISGGTITTLTNKAGSINSVTGGSITTLTNDSESKISNNKLTIYNGTINSISGGDIGTLENKYYSTIKSISGGNINKLTNDTFNGFAVGTVESISGGNINTLDNKGTVKSISGATHITTLTNQKNNGIIESISGGVIETLTNQGAVNAISNSAYVGTLTNSGSVGSILDTTRIETLTNSGTLTSISNSAYVGTLTNSGNVGSISGTARISALDNTGTIADITLNDGNIGLNSSGHHLNGTITKATVQAWKIKIDAPASEWNAQTSGDTQSASSHIFVDGANIGSWDIAEQAISLDIGDKIDMGEYDLSTLITSTSDDNTINYSHIKFRQGLEFDKNGNKFRFTANASESLGAAVLQSLAVSLERRNITTQSLLDSLTPQHFNGFFQEMNATSEDEAQQSIEKWRFFAMPYAVQGSYKPQGRQIDEFAGGVLFGLQRDMQEKGVLSAYLGYEYAQNEAELSSTTAKITANAVQAGLMYAIAFEIDETKEWYIKSNLRGQFATPKFSEDNYNYTANISSYSVGVEGRAGFALKLTEKNYLAPELGVSYDALMLGDFTLSQEGDAAERYKKHTLHLPQILGNVKWVRKYGEVFSTAVSAGLHYNLLNKPSVEFAIAQISDTGEVELPSLYANVGLNAIWQLNESSQISLGYSGAFHSNGMSNALALKYGLRF